MPHDADRPEPGPSDAFVPDRERAEALASAFAKLPRDRETFWWAGYTCHRKHCWAEAAEILTATDKERRWFEEGRALNDPDLPECAEKYVHAVRRTIDALKTPTKKKKEPASTIPGLKIVSIERTVARGVKEGLLSITVEFAGQNATLDSMDGVTVTTWNRFKAKAAQCGVFLPSEEGYARAWGQMLVAAQPTIKTTFIEKEETLLGAVEAKIRAFLCAKEEADNFEGLRNDRVVIERDFTEQAIAICVLPQCLIDFVIRGLPNERVTREIVGQSARGLGAVSKNLRKKGEAWRPRVWEFPASITKNDDVDDDTDPAAGSGPGPLSQQSAETPTHWPPGDGKDEGLFGELPPPGADDGDEPF